MNKMLYISSVLCLMLMSNAHAQNTQEHNEQHSAAINTAEVKSEKEVVSAFTSFIDEHDEQEVREAWQKQHKNSAVSTYALQIGVMIFLKYLDLKEALAARWSNLQQWIQSKIYHDPEQKRCS